MCISLTKMDKMYILQEKGEEIGHSGHVRERHLCQHIHRKCWWPGKQKIHHVVVWRPSGRNNPTIDNYNSYDNYNS